MTYSVVHIPDDVSTQLEQMGTKGKFWYRADDGSRALFKEGRPGTGENWAEKVCCEIARLLGLPHAEYELAIWKGRQGVACRSIVPKTGRLILANELLASVSEAERSNPVTRYRDSQHTLRRAIAVLRQPHIQMPIGWPCPDEIGDAVGVFVGYVLLDALVSNQDRHRENWGLIFAPESGLMLAPTFDHASSLGRNESDDARMERLTTKDGGRSVEHYVSRARSGFYETQSSNRPMKTLDAFSDALKRAPNAGKYWLRQLSNIDAEMLKAVLLQMPNDWISVPAVEFAHAMLVVNRNRLLNLSKIP